ncbi:MAG: amidohydrolase family protein [Bacilli bacterium]|nr:amidohydrolase family protein [Bacilli bacterium]
MHLFDAHSHIASWHSVPEAERNLLLNMDRHGIDATLVSNADCTSFADESTPYAAHKTAAQGLKEVLDFAARNPGRIFAAAWVCPHLEPEPPLELASLIKANLHVVKALKLHPFCEQIAPDDPRLEPYYEIARTLGLPILSHTAVDENSKITHLAAAAKAHPELCFVAAHLELCSDHRFAIETIKDVPNVYADTAWVDLPSAICAIEALGENRVMFGTDSPIDGANTLDNPIYRDYFENVAHLDERTYSLLMRENALRLYKI